MTEKKNTGLPASIASSSHLIAASASAAGSAAVASSANSALGNGTVPTPPESTKDLSSPENAPVPTTASKPEVNKTFDLSELEGLKLPDTLVKITSTKQITNIQIRRPLKTDWVRTRPDGTFGPIGVITTPEDRATFTLAPGIAAMLDRGEYDVVMLHWAITTTGTVFFWPVRVTERTDGWAESMRKAIALSEGTWVRVVADMAAGEYQVHTPDGDLPPPLWPSDLTFTAALKLATKRMIDSQDHPVLRRLRGQW